MTVCVIVSSDITFSLSPCGLTVQITTVYTLPLSFVSDFQPIRVNHYSTSDIPYLNFFTRYILLYYTCICIARLCANTSNTLRYGSHSVSCKQHHICLYSQSQSITAFWLVLVAPTHGGMTRLS